MSRYLCCSLHWVTFCYLARGGNAECAGMDIVLNGMQQYCIQLWTIISVPFCRPNKRQWQLLAFPCNHRQHACGNLVLLCFAHGDTCMHTPTNTSYLLPAAGHHRTLFFLYICIYDRNILALKFIGRRNSLASMHFWIMLIIYLVCLQLVLHPNHINCYLQSTVVQWMHAWEQPLVIIGSMITPSISLILFMMREILEHLHQGCKWDKHQALQQRGFFFFDFFEQQQRGYLCET